MMKDIRGGGKEQGRISRCFRASWPESETNEGKKRTCGVFNRGREENKERSLIFFSFRFHAA